MQLFGLVNTLLGADIETFKRHLSIHRYPVIPLSPNSGLIGWVPHCDTLHALIRDYRESHKIMLNIEHRVMHQVLQEAAAEWRGCGMARLTFWVGVCGLGRGLCTGTDGARLREPDAHAKGGGLPVRAGQHHGPGPLQSAVAQEQKLGGTASC